VIDFAPIRAELHKLAYHPDICQFPDRAVAIGEISAKLEWLRRSCASKVERGNLSEQGAY
jgi:hypothetical protein